MLKSKRFRTHLGIVGILLSFAVFSINSGIPKEDDSQRPYFSGYCIGQVRGLSDLYASSDHQHSWAWADRGLSLVDGGNISHPHEIKDLTTASVNEVWETADPNHAWVLCRKDSPWELYLAGMDGSAGRIGLPKEPDRSPNPVLARSARFVWVSPYVYVPSNGRAVRARSLYVVMDDGTVKIVKTNALDSFTIESSSQFHLLGDGSRALITGEHGTSWFRIGIDATDKKITPPSIKGRTIFREYPVADTN